MLEIAKLQGVFWLPFTYLRPSWVKTCSRANALQRAELEMNRRAGIECGEP